MISALKELVLLVLAFDHYNYTRWIPLFIEVLEILPKRVNAEFEMGRIVTVPELCRVVEEFEEVQNELSHQQEGRTSQRRFLCHIRDLIDGIIMNGNPFEEQL